MRIVVRPCGATGLETRISVRELDEGMVRGGREVALRSLPLPGGLGAHKWVDRRAIDAAQAGLDAAALPLLIDADGALLEASRANVFALRDGVLSTPPLDGRILPGITRARVLGIAAAIGIEACETELRRDDLLAADEVFLTGSVRGFERVRALDGTLLAARGGIGDRIASELRRAISAADR